MIQIYNNNGIIIIKNPSNYQLICDTTELTWQQNFIIDQNGSTIMSFKPSAEIFWDIKLFFNKRLSIGICNFMGDINSVYIQGIKNQRIYYGEDHLISKTKMTLSTENKFKNNMLEHLALLLLLAVYNDRKE